MRCKSCDYRLWNLPSRICPECGAPFKPSDFEFTPNTVQFCCPHCQQAYYGTDAKGHLAPVAFNCATCGRRIHMDDMILLPAPGTGEEATVAERIPWLERKSIGGFKAWMRTVKMSMLTPTKLARLLPTAAPTSAWWFAYRTFMSAIVIGLLVFFLIPMIGAIAGRGGTVGVIGAVGGTFGMLVGASLTFFVLFVLWGAITYGLLRLGGPVKGTIGKTFDALGYAVGPIALGAIPCVGIYTGIVGAVWCTVSGVLMVRERQQVSGGRAALAVLTLPVLCMVGVIVFYASIVYIALSSGSFNSTIAASTARNETRQMTKALVDHARQHGPLKHALSMVADGGVSAWNFISSETQTSITSVTIGETSLDLFADMDPVDKQALLRRVVKKWPDNVVAHRVGDFVFVNLASDLGQTDPSLWIVIASPDPAYNSVRDFGGRMYVGQADGSVHRILSNQFKQAIDQQNQLRATLGLAPLPAPSKIREEKPATSPRHSSATPEDGSD